MNYKYDIFISYKRKSLPTANNLYYRLTTRGYSTFFDLEEMGRDNFNVQLLNCIENAKDVFVILEEGSIDGCQKENWEEEDWFCHEIAFALEKKKNIIPILLNGYQMPSQDFFPDRLKELSLKNAPEFNFSFFEAYLDKLIEKDYLLSKPNIQDKTTSVFKFYSNENCQVFKEGKLVCSLEGMSDEPYYLPVPRKGDYRFKAVNYNSKSVQILNESIDAGEEKSIEVKWYNEQAFRTPFHGNHKGCSVAISIALLILIVFLPVRYWLSSYNRSLPTENMQSVKYDSSSSLNTQTKDNNYDIDDKENDVVREDNGPNSLSSDDFVDLGLSVNWASKNVGATSPEDAGGYYAWGEIKEKDEYTEESYEYRYVKYGYTQTKKIASNISGTRYDVARSLLGENYRMPTKDEMKELILKCDWHYGTVNEVPGMVVTGKNGNCIFIPDVGSKVNMSTNRICYYWTSTADEYGIPYCLFMAAFPEESKYDLINHVSVEHGLAIRPVVQK
ncbi:MAG: toll/interleukin-1 receptor domain-containing protein [Prevotella sp.]|nr:toll/interleukin-1 receptor domain-containing protein [Prevotella sp.]